MTIENVVETYERIGSVAGTATALSLSECVVVKALVTAGAYDSPRFKQVAVLRSEGKTAGEIAAELGITRTAIDRYIPYGKGSYALGEKTENAQRIAHWRAHKKEME